MKRPSKKEKVDVPSAIDHINAALNNLHNDTPTASLWLALTLESLGVDVRGQMEARQKAVR